MEPLLFKTACSRGTQGRMSCEYRSFVQDADGVTATIFDRLTGKDFTVRAKYMIGADGGNSRVAEQAGIPLEGQMGVCLLYTSPSPRDRQKSRMPSSA